MSQKDYELIAAALKLALNEPAASNNKTYNSGWDDGVKAAASAIAEALEAQNAKFNSGLFLHAVGVL